MSLNRLLLRALAINALTTQPSDAAPITMAGDNVFDSRLDPAQFDTDVDEFPLIVVYTDNDGAQVINRSDNTGPFRRTVELRIEIALGSFDTFVEDDKKVVSFGVPTTDAEMEARLDMFEQQVRWALLNFPARAATNAFLRFIVRTETIESHVERDESGNNRLALRRLNLRLLINDDCPPVWSTDASQVAPDGDLTEAEFTSLPEWLRPMMVAMQKAPSVRGVIDVLGGNGRPAVIVPILRRVGVKVTNLMLPADHALREAAIKRVNINPAFLQVWSFPRHAHRRHD